MLKDIDLGGFFELTTSIVKYVNRLNLHETEKEKIEN